MRLSTGKEPGNRWNEGEGKKATGQCGKVNPRAKDKSKETESSETGEAPLERHLREAGEALWEKLLRNQCEDSSEN